MADFKISNIRFTWKGPWSGTTSYIKDDVVRYNNKTYTCDVTHTSAVDFYTDLNAATPKWTLTIDGQAWKGNWANATFYKLNDVVKWGGLVYNCNTQHTSQTYLEQDQAKWTVYAKTEDWKGAWSTGTYYKINDVVKYGATFYRCIVQHTSAANATLGLESDQAKWEIITQLVEYKTNWVNNTRYKVNDVVKYGGNLYRCIVSHTATGTFSDDEANWTHYLRGQQYEDVWSSSTVYQPGDIVYYGGYTYLSKTNHSNRIPTQNASDWEISSKRYRMLGDWSGVTSYRTGDLIRLNGYTYLATADNTNQIPPNGSYWEKLSEGIYWRGPWSSSVSYNAGNAVVYGSTTYICILAHSSATGNRPDNDVSNTYWIILAQGKTTNKLTSVGDLLHHNGSSTARFGIGSTGNLLQTNTAGTNLTWQMFDDTTNVYYVASNGVDSLSYGTTIDKPFLTIKYACQNVTGPATIYVKTGTYSEILPISIPANVSLVGDEHRTVRVQPASGYTTSNMFYMRDGSILRNMTLQGLVGTLGVINLYGTRRPTAGAYVSLDPGTGINDSSVWITNKSPYVQNVSALGTGCTGLKVDGNLHNGGYDSIVANDFTQIISDGIGAWVTNKARAELVSIFTYYCHIGYLAEDGGKIRATNGNNSYGTFGSVSEGIDLSESPTIAVVDNRSFEATVGNVFTSGSQIYRLEYDNAGSEYTSASYTFEGSGLNAAATADEFRDNGIYQIRVIDPGDSSGGGGAEYATVTSFAQSGNTTSITISATDSRSSSYYQGMRILIISGAGVGQYGYIQSYNSTTKVATIYKESTSAAGWDHVVPGTSIVATLNSTTQYIIEPRITVSSPGFTSTARTLASGTWTSVTYGNGRFVAVASGSTTSSYSTNGTSWTAGGALPASTTWTGVASGAISSTTYFVAVASGGTAAAYSTNGGTSWTSSTLPSSGTWADVAYGNSKFVAVASGGTAAAYSTNGTTWSSATLPSSSAWSHVVYGNGTFVAVSTTSSTAAAYSTDGGANWTSATLPSSANWTSVAYGNGRFVAVASGGTVAAYSFDGITWTASTLPASSDWSSIEYGQGLFFAVSTSGTQAATSQDGVTWTSRTMSTSASGYTDVAFGNPSNSGIWVATGGGTGTVASSTVTGATAMVRAKVLSGKITNIRIIEPGSGYTSTPTLTITDPNNTVEISYTIRTSTGVLANPSFSNKGTGYLTASATITGNGYADNYQIGKYLYVKNLSAIPTPGANIQISGIDNINYKLVAIANLAGSAPNYTARLQVSPIIKTEESPIHSTSLSINQRYSQVRLTGHDFLDIGVGNFATANYPNINISNRVQANEVVEKGGGRVFYTSTDQDGNFRVGELFKIEQATGIASLNADAFDLSGLTELTLGSVILGGTGATIREFSNDPTFTANSDNTISTQKSIKAYIASRIGGGGSGLNVNGVVAGVVHISGTTITTENFGGNPTGQTINVTAVTDFRRPVKGTLLAMLYYTNTMRSRS